jgi:hypothetical protein
MVATYPVRVPRKDYRGSDAKRRRKIAADNQLAERLESYVNEQVAKAEGEYFEILYADAARDLNESLDDVTDILMGVDGGHNGLTVQRRG